MRRSRKAAHALSGLRQDYGRSGHWPTADRMRRHLAVAAVQAHNPRPLTKFAPPATNFASGAQKPLAKLGIGQQREEMFERRGAAPNPNRPFGPFQHLAGSDDFLTESWL
jgi:hypothetical protein